MVRIVKFLLIFVALGNNPLLSQALSDVGELSVVANIKSNKVMIRWAPNNPKLWNMGNKYGYSIERYTLLRDTSLLQKPERTVLTSQPLYPADESLWGELYEKDPSDYVLIAAQALHGQNFNVTNDFDNDILSLYNKVKEEEQRYNFLLFAADQSLKVAGHAGLYYEDNTILHNEKYLYRVICNLPDDHSSKVLGSVYVDVSNPSILPKPEEVSVEFSHKTALISCRTTFLEGIYNHYIIERSEDGVNFKSINDLGIVNTSSNGDMLSYLDSLPENEKIYYYRIRGKNIFEEIGPPSDILNGFGYEGVNIAPKIKSVDVINEKEVQIQWSYPTELNDKIKGFKLFKSINAEKFDLLSVFPSNVRSFSDRTYYSSNYYQVEVTDLHGKSMRSMPYQVLLKDSIPPTAPVQLVGNVDELGVVNLSWKANEEPDLAGYQVFRSSFKNSEFYQASTGILKENHFVDTLNLNTLDGYVYYKILALDFHLNPSGFSKIIQLNLPDNLPPVPPVISSIISGEDGIRLDWINSTSHDFDKSLIYKRSGGSSGFELLKVFNAIDSISSFVDNSCEHGVSYNYLLIAVDRSGLESRPSKMVTGKLSGKAKRQEFKNIIATADREEKCIELRWDYAETEVINYKIFKEENERMKLYEVVPSHVNAYKDKRLEPNNTYKYRIKALFEDGSESMFSKEILINY